MLEREIRVLNHSLSCAVGDLSRGNSHRSFREEGVRRLEWCGDHEGKNILRNDEMRRILGQNSCDKTRNQGTYRGPIGGESFVRGVLGIACKIWCRDHSDDSCRWSKSVKGIL